MRTILMLAALMAAAPAEAQTCDSYSGKTVAPVSIDTVIAAVSKLPSARGEFETTEQFNARVRAALGTVSGSYIVGVKLDPKYAVYDADRGVFQIQSYALDNVNASWDAIFGYGRPLYEKVPYSSMGNIDIVVSTQEVKLGTYRGSNAFGATATISRIRRSTKAIFEREAAYGEDLFFPPNPTGGTRSAVIAEIQADPASARVMKTSMKGAVVIVPQAPWFAQGKKNWGEPTLDAPEDIDETVSGVIADFRCALVLDASNKVLAAVTTR